MEKLFGNYGCVAVMIVLGEFAYQRQYHLLIEFIWIGLSTSIMDVFIQQDIYIKALPLNAHIGSWYSMGTISGQPYPFTRFSRGGAKVIYRVFHHFPVKYARAPSAVGVSPEIHPVQFWTCKSSNYSLFTHLHNWIGSCKGMAGALQGLLPKLNGD